MQLISITFAHGEDTPAVKLRRSYAEGLPLPEWRPGTPTDRSEAAYPLDEADRELTVEVEMRAPELAGETVEVRALEPPLPPAWDDPALVSPEARLLFLTTAVNVLGGGAPRLVTLDAAGRSGRVRFRLTPVRIADAGTGVYPVTWEWQLRRREGDPWTPFATSAHTIYLVASRPREPWRETPFSAQNRALPWTSVLAWACRWAFPSRTPAEAAARITRAVYSLGTLGVIGYGCPVGGMSAYTNGGYFLCTAFLDLLAGRSGAGVFVNCTDCASIVSTFANALGCDLWQSQMNPVQPFFGAFRVRPVLTIGAPFFGAPCGLPGFAYHEVAWTGSCGRQDDVYDASLAVDDRTGGAAPRPLVPTGLRFGWPGAGVYLDLLCTLSGRLICTPRPVTRQRRSPL